jgi:SAM-dependent methyltransferase
VSESGAASYGDAFADVYDRWYADVTDVEACARYVGDLAAAAGGAAVLELGAGTGRLALPLSSRGLAVTAVDASAAMLDALRAKPGAERLRIVQGDMSRLDDTELSSEATFAVVLIAYNTLFNLPDDDALRACLDGVAARLTPPGRLVVEAFVPIDDAGPSDDVTVSRVERDEVVLAATVHDPTAQVITGQHVQITEEGRRLRPWRVHYLRPDQLDHLAASCGLTLVDRWSDWDCTKFDDDSSVHISTYARLGGAGSEPTMPR